MNECALGDRVKRQAFGRATLIHGEFCFRNVLVDLEGQGGQILGLIDFEKARVADPLEDIGRMLLYSIYWQREHTRAFIDAYGVPALPSWIDRLEFHLLGFGLEVASWASTVDPTHFSEVRQIVSDIVSRPGAWVSA